MPACMMEDISNALTGLLMSAFMMGDTCNTWTRLLLVLLVGLSLVLYRRKKSFTKSLTSPEATKALPQPLTLPVYGNLIMLGREPHIQLTRWSQVNYGDLFRLQLGQWDAVVINGYHTCHEALVQMKDTFASRPAFTTFQNYAGGQSISFHPYDRTYRWHRLAFSCALRKCVLDWEHLPQTEHLIAREIDGVLSSWLRTSGQHGIDPTRDITLTVSGVLYSLCFGYDKLIQDDTDFADILTSENPATEQFGAFSHAELLPSFHRFFKRKLHESNTKRMKKMTQLNTDKCNEYAQSTQDTQADITCILGFMMNKAIEPIEETKIDVGERLRKRLLSSTIEMLSAGSETSSATLLWLLVFMAKYPEAQSNVVEEVHRVVDRHRFPCYADRHRLPYTFAVVTEVMRITSIVPFALPHSALRDSNLNGYHIPKDTLIFVNLWSVNHDLRIWDNPDDFRPERFLTVDSLGRRQLRQDLVRKVASFSMGRRRCVGEMLGKVGVFLVFVRIMQMTKVSSTSPLSMRSAFGDVLKPPAFKLVFESNFT